MDDRELMQLALVEAHMASAAGEVPVGAICVVNGEIVARGQNRVIRDTDPTAHAEVVALRAAAHQVGNYRLTACEMFVTIEPCTMCAGAMIHSRIRRLVYGAPDLKAGAAGSVLQVLNHPSLNHRMQVQGGVLEEQCGTVLREFFREKR